MDEVPEKLPGHVAIIMDGNGRWAHARHLSRADGHIEGAESARAVARCCADLGIPYLTLYAFSTENWNRPEEEVNFLMEQLARFLRDRREELVENRIGLKTIGCTHELPRAVRKELERTQQATAKDATWTLVLALNYGARSEIVDACRKLAAQVKAGRLDPDDIDEELLSGALYTAGIPDPDLLIRTGGERRLSNFLLWQISYAELYVTDVLWPDFRREQFLEALRDYAARDRRFGRLESSDKQREPWGPQ